MDQDQGCDLGFAADLVLFLTQQVHQRTDVIVHTGYITRIEQQESGIYNASLHEDFNATSVPKEHINATKIVLANGSQPIKPIDPQLPELDLDLALTPSLLKKYIEDNKITSMAVVGSSHSAILALKNITECAPDMDVIHFYRSQLRFAVYQKDWILYDNTGLKGIAADWARKCYRDTQKIQKVKLTGDPVAEVNTYERYHHLGTKTVYAIGFSRSNVPVVSVRGEAVALKIDPFTGKFNLPGIFGCGIAYPEQVTDPAGNVEFAVGFFKFMQFVKKVCKDW